MYIGALEKGIYGTTAVNYLGLAQLKKNKAVIAEKRTKSIDQSDYENLVAVESHKK